MCPYGGTTPEQDKTIDNCLSSGKWKGKMNKRTGKPYTESEKVAICKSQATKSSMVDVDDKIYFVTSAEMVEAISDADDGTEIDIQSLVYDEKNCECAVYEASIEDDDADFDMSSSSQLSHIQRRNMPDDDYCLVYTEKGKSGDMVKRRRFPVKDVSHIRHTLKVLQHSDLSEEHKSIVKSALVKKAKKFGIKINTVSSTVSLAVDDKTLKAAGMTQSEMEEIRSVKPTKDGTFVVFAGMEGQLAKKKTIFGSKISPYSSEFFESNYKGFEGTFYYPGHDKAGDLNARVAKVVKSFIKKIGKNGKVAMFHEITPRTEAARSDIEGGYYSDVSIDTLHTELSPDGSGEIVDGQPYGTAFTIAVGKGCPQCGVVHSAGICEISESPTGTSSITEVPGRETISEVKEMTKGKGDTSSEENEDVSKIEPSSSGISLEEAAMMRSRIEELEHKDRVSSLVTEVGLDGVTSSLVMSIVSDDSKPEDRLEAFSSVVGFYKEELKNAVESKLTKDEAPDTPSETDGKRTQSEVNKLVSELMCEPIDEGGE